MIVKLIQNLEIKMESQINSLETRIEKMQERFNKDLEEIKKSQNIMNNAINEINIVAILMDGKWYLTVISISISLTVSDTENLFICCLAIRISSFQKFLFKFFVYF